MTACNVPERDRVQFPGPLVMPGRVGMDWCPDPNCRHTLWVHQQDGTCSVCVVLRNVEETP